MRHKYLLLLLLLVSPILQAQENLKDLVLSWEKIQNDMTSVHNNIICNSHDSQRYGFLSSSTQHHIEVSVISFEEGLKLFQEITRDEVYPFNYPEDGCYARAHKMAWHFDKKNLSSAKIFLEGNLKVETDKSPKGYVSWWYHVAPVLLLEKDGEIAPYVFDPSLFEEPVKVEEWKNIQTGHEDGHVDSIYFTERFNYYPMSKNEMMCSYTGWHCTNTNSTLKNYKEIEKQRNLPSCEIKN